MKKTWVLVCALCMAMVFAETGEAKAGPDVLNSYASHIGSSVKRNFKGSPEWSRRNYDTTARIELDRNGRVLGVLVTKTSGNRDFDNAVVTAIKRAGRFAPPPVEGMRVVGLRFNSKMLNKF